MINLNNFKDINIYFIGIGGISMSSLAYFSLKFGAQVSGSDMKNSDETKKLIHSGINVNIGHDEENITQNINLVVYSGAISEDNPELKRARELDIKTMERSEFLGLISSLYLNSVVVAGTHGKTTTTAMLGEIFIRSGINPSIHLGGESLDFGNYRIGNKDIFITEGCEYRNSIKYLSPMTCAITSIELDHTDYYQDYSDIESAFLNLVHNTKNNVVIFDNIDFAKKIDKKINIINVGFGDKFDICGKNIKRHSNGCYSFDVYYHKYIGRFHTSVVGFHNAKNALLAIAVSLIHDISISDIYNGIRYFQGVKRRFERVGSINNIPVICDYAHHPTEIVNSINTAKDIFKKVTVVFQPHTYSRTIGLKDEFERCFSNANKLILFKTYPAREKYIPGGSAKDLLKDIKHNNKHYCEAIKTLKQKLSEDASKCILVLGAGDIYNIVKGITKNT